MGSNRLPEKGLPRKVYCFPENPLLAPVRKSCDRQEMTKLNPITPFDRAWQEENLFLKIRSEAEYGHYLGHPRPGDASQPS